MNRLRILGHRLRGFFAGRQHDARLSDEIRGHLDALTEQHLNEGMSLEDARNAARRDFGGVANMADAYRDQRGLPQLDALKQDLRYAARTLRKTPGFTCAVVVTLAVGIGANSAIFSVMNAVMLRPLPVPHPEELFVALQQGPAVIRQRVSYPMFERFRQAAPSGVSVAALTTPNSLPVVFERGESERLMVQLVSGDYFPLMALAPSLGRLLTPDDMQIVGKNPVAVLSHAFWRRRFGSRPDVLGRTVAINGTPLTVVGVAAAGFSGDWLEWATDLWIPATMQHEVRYRNNYSNQDADEDKPWATQDTIAWVRVIGRAERGSRDAAAAAFSLVFQQSMARTAERFQSPDTKQYFLSQRLTIDPFATGFSGQRDRLMTPLFALLATVTLTLLVACANTANLLLARAAARQREIAVRLSMGANRGRLIRQLLTESAVLVTVAAALGAALAFSIGPVLGSQLIETPAGMPGVAVPFDARVLGYTGLVSIVTVLLFGLAPAFRATRVDLGTTLKSDTRTVHGSSHLAPPKLLVTFQVALSVVLVVAAGLFVRSFRNLMQFDLGFQADRVISAPINPRVVQYPPARLPDAYRRILERVEQLPEVSSAALVECLLATSCHHNNGLQPVGYQPAPGEQVRIEENHVSPAFFSTVGMRLVAGRSFTERDRDGAARVAIVNETVARRFFAGRSAVGARLRYARDEVDIVGVVRDAHVTLAREDPIPTAYLPIQQFERPVYAGGLEVRVSGDGDPARVATAVRKAIVEVVPDLPVESVGLLTDQLNRNVNRDRLVAVLSGVFGVLGLALASVGLFGVMSYNVARRTAELGVRLALGAPRAHVLAMILRESLAPVVLGLIVGLVAVLMVARLIAGLLFGVDAHDPFTIAQATATLIAAAALAALLPAWRASRVDPMVALRHE